MCCTAIDTTTQIAYVTFKSPAECKGANTVEDLALFDLSQATFTPGSPAGTWNTPGQKFVALSELQSLFLNGTNGIAIVAVTGS